MSAWREVPLIIGQVYRVDADVQNQHERLVKGQIVEFVSADYSHYYIEVVVERDLIIDRERMYRLFEVDDGGLCLGVLCGGIAMYEVTFALSDDEVEQYKSKGKDFLDKMSLEVARHPEKYEER